MEVRMEVRSLVDEVRSFRSAPSQSLAHPSLLSREGQSAEKGESLSDVQALVVTPLEYCTEVFGP